MKKFAFRLESLLKYRAHLEDRAKTALARAENDVVECMGRMEEIKEEIGGLHADLEAETANGINIERYKMYTDYITLKQVDLKRENAKLDKLQAVVVKKRKDLSKKTIEKKMLENLKEKQKEAYYGELLKQEEKESDDMTIVRKARDLIGEME